MKPSRWVLYAAAALVLVGLLYFFYGGSAAPAGQPPLVSLNAGNFDQFRRAFNSAKGTVRVVALLSPT